MQVFYKKINPILNGHFYSFMVFLFIQLFFLGCETKKVSKIQDLFSSNFIHISNFSGIEVPSRYWLFDDCLIHFVTNINDSNSTISPIVYVHGLSGSLEDFSELIPLNHKENTKRPFVALDLPHFGKSIGSKSEFSIHKYSLMLKEFLSNFSSLKVNLVCHSLGGQVCIDFALAYPDRVHLLTLISPAGVYQRSEFVNDTLKKNLGINIGPIDHINARSISDLSWYNQEFTRKLVTNNSSVLMALESYRNNFHFRIQQIKSKTLIIWGKEDKIFSYENGLFLKENINNAKLYIMDKADHFPLKNHAQFISKLIQENL